MASIKRDSAFMLVGTAIGVAAGFGLSGLSPAVSPPETASAPAATHPTGTVLTPDADRALEKERAARERVEGLARALEVEIAALRGRTAGAPVSPRAPETAPVATGAALDTAAVAARLRAIEEEMNGAIAANDGMRALALLRELGLLGTDAWPTAVKVFLAVEDAREKNLLEVDRIAFTKLIRSGSFPHLFEASLRDQDHYDLPFRKFAAGSLPWCDREGVPELFLQLLVAEKDEDLVSKLAGTIQRFREPAHVPGLIAALEAQSGKAQRLTLVQTLDEIPGEAAARALETLALGELDDEVRQTAELDVKRRHLPVAGYFLASVDKESVAEKAGLRPGDVFTAFQGVPLRSLDDVDRGMEGKNGQPIVLSVWRDGRVFEVSLTVSSIWNAGFDGRMARPPR